MIELDFSKYGGLIPAIAQDFRTGEVLMLANINPVYYSRSRKRLWRKGEESGNVQLIREILVDCDGDSVIFKVEQIGGAACHTGHRSCFYRKVDGGTLVETGETVFDPKKVYNKQ